MNVLILAAGYATRLYPLTLHKAKPLLEVAGKPMIEWVLDNLVPIPKLETVYVVTNNKLRARRPHSRMNGTGNLLDRNHDCTSRSGCAAATDEDSQFRWSPGHVAACRHRLLPNNH